MAANGTDTVPQVTQVAQPMAAQVAQLTPAQVVAALAPHARKYSLAFASWVETTDIISERPAINVDGLERWKDEESYKLGVRAELYDIIPDDARAAALAHKGTVCLAFYFHLGSVISDCHHSLFAS